MRRFKSFLPVVLVAIQGFWIASCFEFLAGGSSTGNNEPENATISGVLYNPDGAPAANVTVHVLTVDHDPRVSISNLPKTTAGIADTLTTDDSGRFVSDSLPDGRYNVLAKGGSNVFLEDSVEVVADAPSSTGEDTLRAPGSLSGVIRLEPGHSSTTVLILVFGTNTLAAPLDSIGNFNVAGMAGGSYHVRFLSLLPDYGTLDTTLSFTSNLNAVLSDTLRLPFTGIPLVVGLTVTYDTLLQTATLSWNRGNPGLAAGYNVYRSNTELGGTPVRLNAGALTDTVYVDSTGAQDSTYQYQVVAVDAGGNEGEKGPGLPATFSSAFAVVDTLMRGDEPFHAMARWQDRIYRVTLSGLVEVFDAAGNLLQSWRMETPLEELYGYNALSVKNTDTLIIVDKNSRLNFYTSTGVLFHEFTVPFAVRGLATIDSVVYLGDSDNRQMKAYSMDGTLLSQWTQRGGSVGTFGPFLDITSTGTHVFVLESNDHPSFGNSKILIKYDTEGNFLSERIFNGGSHLNAGVIANNNTLYLASNGAGYLLDTDFNTLARLSLFAGQTGILGLSSDTFLAGASLGYFLRFDRR